MIYQAVSPATEMELKAAYLEPHQIAVIEQAPHPAQAVHHAGIGITSLALIGKG